MSPPEPWIYLSVKNPELFKNNIVAVGKQRISSAEMLDKMKKFDGATNA